MFGFFKRQRPGPSLEDADGRISGAMFDEANSPEERELERVGEHVHDLLDTLRVDLGKRTFSGQGIEASGIGGLARQIHAREPSMGVGDIELCVTQWLEESYWPEGVSEVRMEKLQAKIDDWVEAHRNADNENS